MSYSCAVVFLNMIKDHDYFMNIALKEAEKASKIDEVPIGCVIVKDNKIIAKSHNKKEINQNPLGHAEIIAIRKATRKLKNWRLEGCTLYVTIEPCLMCCGAIIQSRIPRVVYGSNDPKGGAVESSIKAFEIDNINHRPEVIKGVKKDDCSDIIKKYFKKKREKQN